MSIHDLRCDWCASVLAGPHGAGAAAGPRGVRFAYHPGSAAFRDDSGMLCDGCWAQLSHQLAVPAASGSCAACGARLESRYLVVNRFGELPAWLLCRSDALEFLNRLRTVEPKLDPATFEFPAAPGTDPSAVSTQEAPGAGPGARASDGSGGSADEGDGERHRADGCAGDRRGPQP